MEVRDNLFEANLVRGLPQGTQFISSARTHSEQNELYPGGNS